MQEEDAIWGIVLETESFRRSWETTLNDLLQQNFAISLNVKILLKKKRDCLLDGCYEGLRSPV